MIALALLLATQPPVGQAAPPVAPATAPVSPDAMSAARDLMAATDIPGQMRALMPKMAEAMAVQMRQQIGGAMPPELETQFVAAMRAYMSTLDGAFTPALIDRLAAVYARNFTPDELHRLAALMRDPVMLRYREVTPGLMGELMPLMMTAMKPQQDAFKARLAQIIADWVRTHPADKTKFHTPGIS